MLIKAFRLFVSSTFADFLAERELLQDQVFPALDAYCATKGYQFHPLDLRWGVNEEAHLDQRTAEICLTEVQAAKGYPPPNFLIMIGNRYGWVPLPFAIAQDEFEAVIIWLESCGQLDVVKALRHVYRLDDNHLVSRGLSAADDGRRTSAYTLQSREDEAPELKPAEAWVKLEARLRHALQEAADHLLKLGRIDAAAHEKYFLSLTEQEITHGLPGYRHATESRATSSATSSATDGPEAIAFIREIVEPGVPRRAPGPAPAYIEHEPRLDALTIGLRRIIPKESIVTERTTCDASGKLDTTYLPDFATKIQSKITTAIDRHIAQVEAIERAPDFALQSERAEHRAFREQKLKIFVGRENDLGTIATNIAGGDDCPLVLHGRSGLGKSALLARASEAAETAKRAPVITRFIGASAGSSDIRSLLISVIEDLAAHGILQQPGEFEQDANKFSDQIKALLSSIAKPVVIFLDALDQLRKPYRLEWLPEKLPAALKLVVSVLDDADYETDSGVYQSLTQRLAPHAFFEIEPLGPAQGREILKALERETSRSLQDGQRDYILDQFETAGASPLYLRTAFEIAKSWKSTDTAGAGRYVLAENTAAIIAQLIGDLTAVHHHERELVTRTLGYLTAAKDGLSAKELMEILSRDVIVMQAVSSERHVARTKKLPPSVWVRLNRQLAPFLIEKRIDDQPLLQFFHRQVAQVAREQHYEPVKDALHKALAAYFEARAIRRDSQAVYDKRSLSELPYQLHHAENTPRLGQILMSPDWMQQKLAAFGPRPLIDDYQYARTQAQRLTGQALELVAGPLARDERQLVPQLIGRMSTDLAADDPGEAASIDSLLTAARRLIAPPALVPRWPNFTAPGGPEIRRFEGHTDSVNAVAFSPDGRSIVSGSHDNTLRLWDAATGRSRALEGHTGWVTAVAFSPDGRSIVSCSYDNTLRLWDSATERSRVLEGHSGSVHAVAFSPDGRNIVSGSLDKTLRLWDASSWQSRALEGHTDTVHAVAFSPDGQTIVSGSDDRTVRLWDAASGQSRALEGHTDTDWIRAVAFSPDGRTIVSGSWDKTLRVWDAESGRSRALEGHTKGVRAVAFSPDGQTIVSGSWDKSLRLWDAKSGRSHALEGHTDLVTSVAFSPDGRSIISGSDDHTLRLWDATPERARAVEGHTSYVTAIAISLDGQNIVSGSYEGSLRLWDAASGRSRALEGHTGWVSAVAFSPDGRTIVSGSGDNTLRLWDVATGRSRTLEGHTGRVKAVAFSPDGRSIVSGSDDHTLRLWDAATGRSRVFEGHTGTVDAVAYSPDGCSIVSGSGSNSVDSPLRLVRLWDAASGRSRALEGHTELVNALAFAPDGRTVVSGSNDNTLRLWDTATGRSRALVGHTRPIRAVAFSLDGCSIVSGANDNTLRLWDTASEQSRALEGHASLVVAVAFSPDGGTIVSTSRDNTLRLWDSNSSSPSFASELARFDGDGPFEVAVLSPDGNSLAAGDEGGRVHLLDILRHAADKAAWLKSFECGRQGGSNARDLLAGNATREPRPSAFQRFLRKLLPRADPDV